jgi:hypothetical protein
MGENHSLCGKQMEKDTKQRQRLIAEINEGGEVGGGGRERVRKRE